MDQIHATVMAARKWGIYHLPFCTAVGFGNIY